MHGWIHPIVSSGLHHWAQVREVQSIWAPPTDKPGNGREGGSGLNQPVWRDLFLFIRPELLIWILPSKDLF